MMNKEHAAYIAGLIDGEGSISLIRLHNNQHPSPFISISSSDFELLEWIQNITGLGSIIRKKNYKPTMHKESYTLNIKYNEAFLLLNEVTDYLVLTRKKQRALLILSEYKSVTPRNGRYSKEKLAKKELFYQRFMSI
jgi:hypothetical protein